MKSQNTASKAIIGKALTFSLALCLTGSAALFTTTAYAQDPSANVDASQDGSSLYSADDLDNMLAPIALYPDPLLAQVLVAATFDDQIQDASQLLSAGAVAVDDQPWDDSVKAVAHYPKVLFTLAAQPDWTASIGQAYVAQSTDVMNSIQRLRAMAVAQGNLVSTPQQQVAAAGGVIQILPTRVGFFFLPSYDPDLVFSAPAFISFGPALAIDFSSDDHIDWHEHHVFDGHHHYARTGDGDRNRRGRIQRTRGPVRRGFNPGRDRNRVTRSRYNPVRPTKTTPTKTTPTKTRPTKPTSTKPTSTKTTSTKPTSTKTTPTKTTSTKPTSTKPTSTKTTPTKATPTKPTSTKTAPTKPTSTKTASTKTTPTKPAATKRPGINNSASNRGQVNRGQVNAGANRGQVNRNQVNAGANRGQMNHASVNTATNRGGGARASGRNHR